MCTNGLSFRCPIPSASLVLRGLLLCTFFGLEGCQTTARFSGSTENEVVNGILTMSKPYRQTVAYVLESSGNEQRLQLSSRLGVPVGEAIFLDGELETMRVGSRVLTPPEVRAQLRQLFSVDLPIGAIPAWLSGRPALPETVVNSNGFQEFGFVIKGLDSPNQSPMIRWEISTDEVVLKVIRR
jgi:hypothetical protein